MQKTLHHLSWDVLPTDVEIASHPPSSRYSLDSNNGPSFTTFRSGVSVSSPNLSESPYPSKNRNFIQRQSEQTGGPNVCPTCSIPFNDQVKCSKVLDVILLRIRTRVSNTTLYCSALRAVA